MCDTDNLHQSVDIRYGLKLEVTYRMPGKWDLLTCLGEDLTESRLTRTRRIMEEDCL